MEVHLIDGTYELFRAHFGAPAHRNAAGMEVGAARGLLRSLSAMMRDPACTHAAIAFDQEIESFRNAMFSGYKTGEGLEPELYAQFPLAEQVASALGIVVWPMVEFEADDAMAAGAARFAAYDEVERIHICTPDKDLAQCVRGKRVILHDRMRERLTDEEGVWAKWGVGPESIPDLLGLMGDSADGIPGIPRWGQKSSSLVLARYTHIEDIPDDAADWDIKVRGAAGLATRLAELRDDALLYKRLATLREDVPIEEDLDALEWRGARRAELESLVDTLDDRGALARIDRWRDEA
jgi:5'-3' exonuclease